MTFSPDIHQRFVEQARWTEQAQRLLFQSVGFEPESRILEVGCGTGAFLTSIASISPLNYTGIDIQLDLLKFAQNNDSTYPLACADAFSLPFPNDYFDGVVCHYFLLWIQEPGKVLAEMLRVTRHGGVVAALAEPDYGSRIEYPIEFERIGLLQRESLIMQGANPDIGRQLSTLFVNAGCQRVASGIMGSFCPEPMQIGDIRSEQLILKSDLKNLMEENDIQQMFDIDTSSRLANSRVQFIPTFFGWGFKP